MRPRLSLLIATAVLLVGSGAAILPHTEAQAVGTSTLSGIVCANEPSMVRPMEDKPDGSTGYCAGPLPNATVRLVRDGPIGNSVGGVDKTATTDAAGAYTFTQLPDGEGYTITVTRAQFKAQEATVAVKGEAVHNVALDGTEMTLSGRVVGPDGRPVADARVSLCCTYYEMSSTQDAARTGADGAFRLAAMAGYRSIIVDDASGFEHFSDHRLIDAAPVTLTLKPMPPTDATVTGTVRDQDGNPMAGIRIDAYSYGPPPSTEPMPAGGGTSGSQGVSDPVYRPYYVGGASHATTGADGTYRLGVYAGQVNLNVNAEGYTSRSTTLAVESGAAAERDFRLVKYPAKTAHIVGQVTNSATGAGLQAVAISVRSPEYGIYECSTNGLDSPIMHGAQEKVAVQDTQASDTAIRAPQEEACAITIGPDGTFSGDVSPGYAVIDVHYQDWQVCDGSSPCGPGYYSWTRTLVLASGETRLDIPLAPRPGPDATVSGYVVDEETGKAIAGATIWFWNQDNGAYGEAKTDGDGSYRVRLRSGFHGISVAVMREDGSPGGYLGWQGMLQVEGDMDLDVPLTPGEESHGYYTYAKGGAPMMDAAESGARGAMAPNAGAGAGSQGTGSDDATATGQAFEDLGGGLGAYDAEARRDALAGAGKASPAPAAMAIVAVLGLLALARRRQQA